MRPEIDYSVYLVTGRDLLPPGKDYYESLEESLKGGVTVVQVREKSCDTGEFLDIARRTKELCDRYNVPVLINDRIDIFLAVRPAGIHIGQDDMDPSTARKLIGPDAILGLSTSTVAEAEAAVGLNKSERVVDYVGIGAVWSTASKDVSKKRMLGPDGAGKLLDVIAGTGIRSVAIGGISAANTPFLLHGSVSPLHQNALDGVAVISAIVSSPIPLNAAEELAEQVASFKCASSLNMPLFTPFMAPPTKDSLLDTVAQLIHTVRKTTPLVHQITNSVVVNDSANATLAIGASPIMATNERDCKELSPNIGSLLINSGTITEETLLGMLAAGRAANENGVPVVWDPVAVGATGFRRETGEMPEPELTPELLHHFQPTVIKGNAAEISFLAKSSEVASRGVDAVGRLADPASLVKRLALERRAIVVMTGAEDYISNGSTVIKVSNGHPLLGLITGSGCMTGSLVACFLAAARAWFLQRVPDLNDEEEDTEGFTEKGWETASQLTQGNMLVGALAGVLAFNVAAEQAAKRTDVKGPGTFRAALMDELYALSAAEVRRFANIEILQ